MRSLAARPTALLAAGLIVLAACGGDDVDDTTTRVEQPTDDPAGGEAASDAQAEGSTDGTGTADGGTETGGASGEESSDGAETGGAIADLSCDDLAGTEQALLDAASLGAWTGDTMSFPGLCGIDGADGSASVFTALEATPQDYFAANGYGEPSSDGEVVTATTELGVPSAGSIVDGRVLMVTVDGTVEPRTTEDATAVLFVALEALLG